MNKTFLAVAIILGIDTPAQAETYLKSFNLACANEDSYFEGLQALIKKDWKWLSSVSGCALGDGLTTKFAPIEEIRVKTRDGKGDFPMVRGRVFVGDASFVAITMKDFLEDKPEVTFEPEKAEPKTVVMLPMCSNASLMPLFTQAVLRPSEANAAAAKAMEPYCFIAGGGDKRFVAQERYPYPAANKAGQLIKGRLENGPAAVTMYTLDGLIQINDMKIAADKK